MPSLCFPMDAQRDGLFPSAQIDLFVPLSRRPTVPQPGCSLAPQVSASSTTGEYVSTKDSVPFWSPNKSRLIPRCTRIWSCAPPYARVHTLTSCPLASDLPAGLQSYGFSSAAAHARALRYAASVSACCLSVRARHVAASRRVVDHDLLLQLTTA